VCARSLGYKSVSRIRFTPLPTVAAGWWVKRRWVCVWMGEGSGRLVNRYKGGTYPSTAITTTTLLYLYTQPPLIPPLYRDRYWWRGGDVYIHRCTVLKSISGGHTPHDLEVLWIFLIFVYILYNVRCSGVMAWGGQTYDGTDWSVSGDCDCYRIFGTHDVRAKGWKLTLLLCVHKHTKYRFS